MPITLAEAKVGMTDKVDQAVVDEFRRGSELLDKLTFDDSVSPGTGGSTLTYAYTQLQTPATAAFRALNNEYTAQEAKRAKKTAELKIFGGLAKVDRVIQETSGNLNEMSFQLQQKIKGATNLFHYTVINGDATAHNEEFDGLDVMLTGKSTEYAASVGIDVSDTAKLDTNYKYVLDMLDEFIAGLDGTPSFLMGNTKMITKLQACARRAGYLTQAENAFGAKVNGYQGIPFLDLKSYFNGTQTSPVVPIYNDTGASLTGLTDLYAVTLGLDGVHGASTAGGKIVRTYLPDMDKPGAVKSAEVELVAALVLKNSLKAGVLRGLKVQ